jgi:GTP pyrophosphokinase
MKEDLQKIYTALPDLTAKDKELIEKAYKFAGEKHEGQKRNSGEPYFSHLLATAQNLADLHMDTASIVAGFLHDTLEDTDTKKEELEKEFGKDVLFIVEGVTKISHMRYHGTDRHNESLRRLLLATSEDIRVLVVKLSDRLHNMRTLSHVNKEKQRRIAAETLEIYAPIAYRLGIRRLSRELEDLAFPYVYPEGYKELTSLLKQGEEERKERLEQFRKSVSKELVKAGLTEFKSDYRVKGLYSLYKKYIAFKKDFEKIYDVLQLPRSKPGLY